jgi:hypothetical protein
MYCLSRCGYKNVVDFSCARSLTRQNRNILRAYTMR